MNKDYLKEVYKDFFETPLIETSKEEQKEEEKKNFNLEDIDSLLLDDESKELFKKVVLYMDGYSKKEKTRYLDFQLILECNNDETRTQTENLLKSAIQTYQYLKNNKSCDESFYEIDSQEKMKSIFENSIIILRDIKGLELRDDSLKKEIMHCMEENLPNKFILLEGTKEEIDYFFEYAGSLKEKAFPFHLKGKDPDVQDIYQEVLKVVEEKELLEEEFAVKILDYITETYPKTELDYPTYRDKLIREIVFYQDVPKTESKKSLDEIFAKLNELVGLEKVKKTLHELVDYMNLRKKSEDLKLNNINLHMVFLGNPGTGKTTVARILGDILYELGYIKQSKLIEVSSKDLVAEYVGQTAPKTMSVVERALGGILFIDEAYALASKGQGSSYNDEAIATLIKAMEDYRDDLVVIFAGYTKEMQDFLDSNSGIVSRIGYTLEFDDYTEDELVAIFDGLIKKAGFEMEEEAYTELRRIIKENINTKNFGNARFVRNVYEKTIIKHAANTKDKKQKKILRTITKNDISTENLKSHL